MPPRKKARAAEAAAKPAAKSTDYAKLCKDGKLLDTLADEFFAAKSPACEAFVARLKASQVPARLAVGSACTGSGTDLVVVASLERALQNIATSSEEFEFDHCFVCEIDKQKRGWLADVSDKFVKDQERSPCIFEDVGALASDSGCAKCSRHGAECEVRHPNIFTCGFSCKFVSHCNMGASSADKRNCLSDPGGPQNSTTRTWNGALNFIRKELPEICVMENVDALQEGTVDQANSDVVQQELQDCGYEVQAVVVDTQDYALPQRRVRIFFIAVLSASAMFAAADYNILWASFVAELQACKRAPPPLNKLLLASNSNEVQAELRNRMNAKPKQDSSGNWPALHMGHFAKAGVRWGTLSIAQASAESPWAQFLTSREKDVLAFMQWKHGPKCKADIGRSINLAGTTGVGTGGSEVSGTLITGTRLWLGDMAPPRPMLGLEAMSLHGWPWKRLTASTLSKYGNSFYQDMAGNAYSGTVLLSILASVFLSVPWQSCETHEKKTSVAALMARSLGGACNGEDTDSEADGAESD